ncbi:MAG: DNA-directed DNA polymerase II small subunit [Candidatus Lokiarchaeota archaeon]|nr:DNA-directed DNA polymerase II small subunit [Candidatus Lokiarchaeota archaeon]
MADKKIINMFIENGFMVTPETLDYLENIKLKNRENLIRSAIYRAKSLANKPVVITKDFLTELNGDKANKGISDEQPTPKKEKSVVKKSKKEIKHRGKKQLEFPAKDIEPQITIEKDPTGNLIGSGDIQDIHKTFINRFTSLKKLLSKRPDSKNSIPINSISAKSENIKTIGIVTEKQESEDRKRQGIYNYTLEIEDLTGSIKVFIPGYKDDLASIASHIIYDQVICIEGYQKNGTIIADNIYFPDIPNVSHFNKLPTPLNAVLLSDLHFGSKKFLSDKFDNFIEWIKGKIGSERQKELARKIKYILIAGDLIDGVGVYPGHEKNLSIIDLKGQYEMAAEYLGKIPEYITIIIVPGGAHDAVRKALPQEAIPRTYAKSLYSMNNTIILGNPCFLNVHGMKTIMYHGEGLDDIIPAIPGMSYANADLAMIELLKSRHLAPIYGNKVGISPEPIDWLIIDDIPDLFQCGHTHITRKSKYKGVNVINCGTFQGETEYQKSLGIKPTPGIVPIIDLQDFSVKLKKF